MPLRLLKPKPNQSSVEDLFLAHYERVFEWALHLTDHNREQAEDLVHDAFIQLALNPPPIERIENWENYLFVVLRNLHRYQWRRERRGVNYNAVSITDYDSIETGLRTIINFDNRLQIWEELQLACRYALERRETSRAGGAFILRFFHGFYPSEIAKILCGTRPAVTELLRVARAEVRAHLQNPAQLAFLKKTAAPIPQTSLAERAPDQIIKTLREQIFARRAGKCLSNQALTNLYEANHAALIDREKLAHFVVCQNCLSRITRLLGMPDLSDRFPPDMLGPDVERGADSSNSNSKIKLARFGGKNQKRDSLEKFRRKLQAVCEHEPRALWVTVNDSILGTQPIISATSEQTLGLEAIEDVRFVQVLSEQNVPLCRLSVESPPAGDFEQAARINLSDNRTLTVDLSFCGNWRHVRVVYCDSSFESVGAKALVAADDSPDTQAEIQVSEIAEQTDVSLWHKLWRKFRQWLLSLFAPFFIKGFWLRPETITVSLAAPLIALLVFWRLSMPAQIAPSGRELLAQATIAERNFAPNAAQTVYRVLEVEERRAANGELITRYQVEIWQRTAAPNSNEYTATRRVFNANGKIVAGEWLKPDGTRVRKNLGADQEKNPKRRKSSAPVAEIPEAVWSGPSINGLENLTGGAPERIKVIEKSDAYILEAVVDNISQTAVRRMSLTVRKADYRVAAQSLWLEKSGDLREFRFVETKFERPAPNELPPNIFNPDALRPDLPASEIKPGERINAATPNAETPFESANANSAAPVAAPNSNNSQATPEMEVEALTLLSQAKADLREQVTVLRVPNGQLQISGIVETARRKAELLRALAPLAAHPAVALKIQTVSEAVAERDRQPQTKSASEHEVIIEQKDADGDRLAAEDDLRRFFTARNVSAENLPGEIERFAQNAFAASRRVAQHAGALRQTAARFSPAEVEKLSPEARAAWRALITKHAGNLQAETIALRRSLAPVFGESSAAGGAGETVDASDVVAAGRAAARLVTLAAESDRAVRAAFSASPTPAPAAALKSKHFWNNLGRIEQIAAALSKN